MGYISGLFGNFSAYRSPRKYASLNEYLIHISIFIVGKTNAYLASFRQYCSIYFVPESNCWSSDSVAVVDGDPQNSLVRCFGMRSSKVLFDRELPRSKEAGGNSTSLRPSIRRTRRPQILLVELVLAVVVLDQVLAVVGDAISHHCLERLGDLVAGHLPHRPEVIVAVETAL